MNRLLRIPTRKSSRPLALPMAALFAVFLTANLRASGVSDDFNNGNDAPWTRYDPFADILGQTSYASFSFPGGNSLEISSPVSPNPDSLGSARAADVRADVPQTDFYETVDLVGWNNNLDQIVGLVARATTVGLGTTNGYLFVYNDR